MILSQGFFHHEGSFGVSGQNLKQASTPETENISLCKQNTPLKKQMRCLQHPTCYFQLYQSLFCPCDNTPNKGKLRKEGFIFSSQFEDTVYYDRKDIRQEAIAHDLHTQEAERER